MGDESLISIVHAQYNLHHINKYYLNRYVTSIGLNNINIFHHREDDLFDRKDKSIEEISFLSSQQKICVKKSYQEKSSSNVSITSISYVQIKKIHLQITKEKHHHLKKSI